MSKVLYIIALITAIIFYPLYQGPVSLILLVALIMLPVMMGIELLVSALFLRLDSRSAAAVVYRGNKTEIPLRIINNSVFPLISVRIDLRAEYAPGGTAEKLKLRTVVGALEKRDVMVELPVQHCGEADVYLECIRICDLLGFFSVRLFKNHGMIGSVCVIPAVSDRYEELAREIASGAGSASESDDGGYVPTTGPGDVIDFKEYVPGDRLALVHHKLSARFDKDIVKAMGLPEDDRFLLFADLAAADTPSGRDICFEKVMSCAYYLNEMKAQSYVAVDEGAQGAVNGAIRVDSSDSYITAACALVTSEYIPVREERGFVNILMSNE